MAARKLFRENLGLTYEQMSAVTGATVNAINSMENRRRILLPEHDEIYQLYFRHGNNSATLRFSNLNELHIQISESVIAKISARIAALESKHLYYQSKFARLEEKYLRALKAIKGFEYITEIANKGTVELRQRIHLASAIHKRKTNEKCFSKMIRTMIQIEWIEGELRALKSMKEYKINDEY